jgi:hypothetical protein
MPLPPTITDASVTLTFGAAGQYYGYCTIADVSYEFPDKSSYTTLTNSVIAQAITQAAQEIQDQLARIYQMPYTGTDAGIQNTLRDINAKLATSKLIERYFQGSEPDLSPAAAERASWAALIVTDLKNGVIQWGAPFGDAVPMAEKPIYPMASAATIYPGPNAADPDARAPIFAIGRTRYRTDTM